MITEFAIKMITHNAIDNGCIIKRVGGNVDIIKQRPGTYPIVITLSIVGGNLRINNDGWVVYKSIRNVADVTNIIDGLALASI